MKTPAPLVTAMRVAPVSRLLTFTLTPGSGTPLWSIPGANSPFFPVKLGALDDPSGFAPSLHLYTDSAQPWHLMHEGLPRFPKMPPGPPPA